MKVLLNEEIYPIINNDTFTKKMFSLLFKKNLDNVYFYQNEKTVHTFLIKTLVDIIAINEKNVVIFKYLNTPKNKLIEVINDKESTNILICPKNSTKNIKIGETLTFINEDII